MILLVDIGNTRIKWGLLQNRALSGLGAAVHAGKPFPEVLTLVWAHLPTPGHILVSNVAGAAIADALDDYCRWHFKTTPEYVVSARQACGVVNAYEHPTQLGADRWTAIIGAYRRDGGPVCVIGCGTAITVDTVNHAGQHLGGLIAPGIGVMHTALAAAAAAAAIPAEPAGAITLYARETRTAVSSGIIYAAAGLIERVVSEIRIQHGSTMQVLLTGGDAEIVQSMVRQRSKIVPNLVLEGLALLAQGGGP